MDFMVAGVFLLQKIGTLDLENTNEVFFWLIQKFKHFISISVISAVTEVVNLLAMNMFTILESNG